MRSTASKIRVSIRCKTSRLEYVFFQGVLPRHRVLSEEVGHIPDNCRTCLCGDRLLESKRHYIAQTAVNPVQQHMLCNYIDVSGNLVSRSCLLMITPPSSTGTTESMLQFDRCHCPTRISRVSTGQRHIWGVATFHHEVPGCLLCRSPDWKKTHAARNRPT